MKAFFNGKQIFRYVPKPKKNQIWKSESGELIKVIALNKVNNEVLSVYTVNERDRRAELGCWWLNGKEYQYIGYIFI
jgi:hypothetical protein